LISWYRCWRWNKPESGLEEFWEVMEAGDFHLEGPAQEILNELFGALLAARRDI